MVVESYQTLHELKAAYQEKNVLLAETFEPATSMQFYREIFPIGSFQERGMLGDGKPNGIIMELCENVEGRARTRRNTVTDDLTAIRKSEGREFVIMSPVSYFGKSRHARNARFLHAFAIDLDGVDALRLADLLHQIRGSVIPKPTYVVNSGTGLHLYYLLESPIPLYPEVHRGLKALKYALIDQIWNPYTSNIEAKQMQGIMQGFRVVGTQTKLGADCPVLGFRTGAAPVDIDYLMSFIPDVGRNADFNKLETVRSAMQHTTMSLDEARERFPEWYERRVVGKQPRGSWRASRQLYDWWKKRVMSDVTVGHRYFSIMTLAVFAVKCGISQEELEDDAFSFLGHLESMTVDATNHFTAGDIADALEAYNEDAVTFPRDALSRLTGVPMPKNKRNGRKREVHLEYARGIRELRGRLGDDVSGGGRPTKEAVVKGFRQAHPDASKAEIARALGISRTTVTKWLSN